MIFEERHDRDDTGWRYVDCELVLPDRKLLDVFRHAGEEVLAVGVEAGGFLLVLIRWVDYRRVQLSTSYRRRLTLIVTESRLPNTHEVVGHAAYWAFLLGRPHPLSEPLNR